MIILISLRNIGFYLLIASVWLAYGASACAHNLRKFGRTS